MAEITTEAPPPYPGLPCISRSDAPPPYSHIYQQTNAQRDQTRSNELFEPPPVTCQTTSQSRQPLNENHRRMLPLATIRVGRPLARSAPPSYMEVIANERNIVDFAEVELNDTAVRCPPVLGSEHCHDATVEGLCPHCMKEITTKTTYYPGTLVCWMYFVLCLIIGPILAILICFVPKLHDVYHKCPECRKTIHIYKRKIAEQKE